MTPNPDPVLCAGFQTRFNGRRIECRKRVRGTWSPWKGVKGLVKKLGRKAWPGFAYRDTRSKSVKKSMWRGKGKRKIEGQLYMQGRRIGRRIDREISSWASGEGRGDLHKMLPQTRNIVSVLEKIGMQNIRTQVPVADPDAKLGTCIDILADRKHDGALCVIEVKSGMDSFFESTRGVMKGPLHGVANSPQNQALVQLAATVELFRRTYQVDESRKLRAWVVHTDFERTKVIRLPRWAEAHGKELCDTKW